MLDFTNGQALTRTPRRTPAENPYLEARGLEDLEPDLDDFFVVELLPSFALVLRDVLRVEPVVPFLAVRPWLDCET